MIDKLLTEHNLEFLSVKGGCRGSSESTLVKISTCLEITCHGSYVKDTYLRTQGKMYLWLYMYLVNKTLHLSLYRVEILQ